MKWYSRSRADFIDLLCDKYKMTKINRDFRFKPTKMPDLETMWCLGIWETDTDYQLCNGDTDLLPPLVKKDEIRFEYNQWAKSWSRVSCTIFAAMGMLSDLINYEFSEKEMKEVDELSYQNGRIRWQWWYVKSAVDLVAKWYNNSELSNKYGKVAYYRINKYDDDVLEDVINKLYTIDWNHWLNASYTQDRADWMVDGTDFGTITNGHSVDIICKSWQRSVKNSYKGSATYNIYWLKNKLSKITNFGTYFYVYTLVKEDNLEEIKRLNEFKSLLLVAIEQNSKLWSLTNDKNYQSILHYTNEKHRAKIKDIDNELKKYI